MSMCMEGSCVRSCRVMFLALSSAPYLSLAETSSAWAACQPVTGNDPLPAAGQPPSAQEERRPDGWQEGP